MAFRIHKGIFQNLNAAGTAYENAFKVDRDGVMKTVSTDGTVGSAFLKVGDKASDADNLDGINSGSFLRSDAHDSFSGNLTATTNDWYIYGLGTRGASAGAYGIGNRSDDSYRQMTFHVPNQAAYSSSGTIPSFGWYSNGATQLMKLNSDSGNLWLKGSSEFDGRVYADDGLHVRGDWLRVNGSNGIYFESYGGGWRMTDSSWIRAYNDKNIYTGGSIEVAGTIRADNGFQVDGSTIIDGGGTVVGNVNNNTTTADYFVQEAHGNPRNNLGSPTVTEMSLFNEQFNNKTAFYDPSKVTVWQQATDGAPWEDITSNYGDTTIRRFIAGYDTSGNVYIPNGVFKFRIEVSAVSYVFLNALYMYWSSDSHSTKVHVWKRRVSDSQWFQHTSSNTNVGSWPGHLYLPFNTIPFLAGPHPSTGHYDIVRFEFIPNWSGHATYGDRNINLNKMQIWGGYPAGTRFPYTVNEYGDFTSRRDVYASKFIDKDNTGYYLDPVNTSNLLDVTARNITTSGTLSTQGQTYFSGQTSQLSVENIGSFARLAFNKLDFYDWQWGSMLTLENGNVSTNGTVIATNFADYNDTNYYVNPASDARLRHLYVGDVAGSNDGSWNARMKVIGSSHARLDVVSNSDGIVTTMFSHTGHGAGKIGTYSNHPLKFIINGSDKAILDSSGNLSLNGSLSATGYNDSNWNTAYSWGNHASAGYLTSLPSHNHDGSYMYAHTPNGSIFNDLTSSKNSNHVAFNAYNITDAPDTSWYNGLVTTHSNYLSSYIVNKHRTNDWYLGWRDTNNTPSSNWSRVWHSRDFSSTTVNNWNTAYGWGNHASAGYLTSLPSHNHDDRYYTETEVNNLLAGKLGSTAKAADSNLLDGIDSGSFLRSDTEDTKSNNTMFTGPVWIDDSGRLGTSKYRWTNSALTTTSIEIVDDNGDNAGTCATLALHNYGDGGVQFRMGNTGDKWLYLSSAKSGGGGTTTDDNTERYFVGMKINGNTVWHAGNFTNNSTNWNTAYGWGNHASAGYLTSLPSHTHGWGEITGKPSTFTPSAHSHYYITNNYSAAESGSLHSWDAQESTPDKNPTTDWFTALRIGHGHPVDYFSNTLAIQMTGGDLGRIYTRTISGGTKQSWRKYWHDGDFSVAAVNNGNTAYSWGNHASAGYLTSLPSHNHNDLYYTESESNARFLGISAKAADSNLLDGIDSSGFVRAYGTTNDNIDSDWGQSFKTFDPVPSGTPPIASPNLRTINVGDNFARRTQLAFTYATDQAWFRRRDSSGWHEWREFIHSGNIGSQSVNYASSAGAVAWGNVSGKPSTFSPSSHNHDDRYYTEAESDARYLQSLPSHNHDDRYYTETEVNTLLAGKLGSTAKAADSNLIDGIDSSRIVYGDGSNGRSVSKNNGSANVSDSSNASGFYFGNNVDGMPTTDWWNWLTVRGNSWSGTDGYQFQLAGSFWGDDYRIRRMQSGTNYAWVSLIHSGNIGSQSVDYATDSGYATTAGTANAVTWGNVSGKPSTFSPSAHTHTPSQVGLSNLSSNGNALAGNFTATGDITAYSDSRVKENVTTIDNALDKVMSLRGVEYNKIGSEEKSLGVIAQEIREVLPEVVKEQEDGMLSVAYGNITAVLIEALKEQQKQIDELKAQIDAITK